MKSLAERLIVSSGLTLLLGTAASAQVVDQPPVVGQPPVIGQPDEVMTTERRAAELRAAQPWSISLGVDELSETAVQPGVAQNSVRRGSQLDGTLNYNWALPRGNVRFNGSANQVFYHEPVKLNQTMYGVGASASYAISRRASWDVGEAVTQRYAQDLTTISDAGLLPPKLVARLYSATGGLRYDLSPRTQMRFGLAEQNVSFDSSLVTGSTSQFGGATAFTVNMTMGRLLSRSQNVVVSAEYQHTKTSGATSAMQAYLAAWQGAFGQRYSLRASAGIRPYSQAGQAGRIAPAVGLGLTARLRRNDSLALSYERSVEQALGIGTHLTQVVTVGYNLSLVRRLSIDASGGYGRGTYPLDPNRLLLGRTGNLSVRYVLVQGLAASVGSSVYVREGTPGPSGTLYRTEISLSYAKAWR